MTDTIDVVERVLSYYRLVDAGDVDGLVALFTEDAVYRRPGYAPICGRRQLGDFYRRERVISSGVHTVAEVVVEDRHGAVRGEFAGTLHDGSAAQLRFADFYVLTERGLFQERETFFAVAGV